MILHHMVTTTRLGTGRVVKAGEIDIISAGNPVPVVYFQFLR